MKTVLYLETILELLQPGEPVIITHLMNVLNESGEFSHLSSTNETEIFIKSTFTEKRFQNEKTVDSFMQHMEKDFRPWSKLLKTFGGIGGYHPGCQQLNTTSQRNYLETRCQVRNQLKKLLIKESDRMVLKANFLSVKLFEHSDFDQCNSPLEVIGDALSSIKSVILPLSGLYSDDIRNAIQDTCLLSFQIKKEKAKIHNTHTNSIIVELLLNDCKVLALWPLSFEAINTTPKDHQLLFNLNLFRYKEPADNKPDWDGVLIVIDSIDYDKKDSQQYSSASTSSTVPNTCDLAKLFS